MLYSLHTDIKWDPWHYNGSINEWLQWLSIQQSISYRMLPYSWRSRLRIAPVYFQELYILVSTLVDRRALRSSSGHPWQDLNWGASHFLAASIRVVSSRLRRAERTASRSASEVG